MCLAGTQIAPQYPSSSSRPVLYPTITGFFCAKPLASILSVAFTHECYSIRHRIGEFSSCPLCNKYRKEDPSWRTSHNFRFVSRSTVRSGNPHTTGSDRCDHANRTLRSFSRQVEAKEASGSIARDRYYTAVKSGSIDGH